MLSDALSQAISQLQVAIDAVMRADAWLDTMRSDQGYTGPVSHWWQNCLQYTGVGLDWRYEGIVAGYLTLFQRTSERRWLLKARRAGDDLVAGILPSGNYRNSSFELNPSPGGTPHEAACDIALLSLAQVLRADGDSDWSIYADTAERNLRAYYLGRLWDADAKAFRDDETRPSFVPNKAATLSEALFLLATLRGDESIITRYLLPTLDAILRHQMRGGLLDGAICQNSFGAHKVEKFLPYYIARCVPGLLLGYKYCRDERYLDGALRALQFVLRCQYEDGSFPQALYPDGRTNRYPQWVAALGDVIRAIDLARPYGFAADTRSMMGWMLHGQQPGGGFATAHGFVAQVSQRRPNSLPDLRDLLPVCGWSDKAFRALAALVPCGLLPDEKVFYPFELPAQLRGKRGIWRETAQELAFTSGTHMIYRWRKGQPWAEPTGWEAVWK